MLCEVCRKGPPDGLSVFRVNPKGQPGIWRCRAHLDSPPDPDLDRAVREIERVGPAFPGTLRTDRQN